MRASVGGGFIMTFMIRILVCLLLPAWLACAADYRQGLLDADAAFDRDTAARGLEGWMSWFAEDAQLNTAGGPLKGKAALRSHYAKMFARPEFSIRWKPFFAEASTDGTLGYTLGTAEISWKNENGEVETRPGRYITVWRREKDGGWKAVTDMGN